MTQAHTLFAVSALVAVWSLTGCGNSGTHSSVSNGGAGGSSGEAGESGGPTASGGANDDGGTGGEGHAGTDDGGAGDGGAGDDGGSLSIGPGGGTLTAAGVELIVPEGALAEESTFSISVLLSGYPELESDYELRSDVIALQPHGLSFSEPVSLALPYTGATVPDLLMITADPGGTWSTVEGASFEEGLARAELMHFSLFAVVAKKPYLRTCRIASETTDLNPARWDYTYDSNGRLSKIEQFYGPSMDVLNYTVFIGVFTISTVPEDHGGALVTETGTFNGGVSHDLFDGDPDWVLWDATEDGITRETGEDWFLYDDRGRLTDVSLVKPTIGADVLELDIYYDEQDNATTLHYYYSTGPRDVDVTYSATYDDKPNPYANIRHFYNVMHANWDNNDTEAVLTALSQHNVLSWTSSAGDSGTNSYEYDTRGLPTHRVVSHTSANGAMGSHNETYTFECP